MWVHLAQSNLLKHLPRTLAVLGILLSNNGFASQVTVTADDAFETALDYLRQNRTEEALLIIRSLKKVPTTPLMLLEIGRIEFELGDYEAAKNTFEKAIENFKLPAAAQNRIAFYLREIATRQGRWSYSVKIKQVRNPNKKPQSGTYTVLGMPLTYTNDEDRKYWGLEHRLSFKKTFISDWSLDSHFHLTDIEGSLADGQTLAFFLSDKRKQKPEFLTYSIELEDGVGFKQKTFGARLGTNARYSSTNYEPSLGFYKIYHSQNHILSGNKLEIGQLLQRPTENGMYSFNGVVGALSLKEKSYSKNYVDFTLSAETFLKDFTLNPLAYISFSEHRATDFLWGTRREDESAGASLAICKKTALLDDNTVCLNFSYDIRDSNISFYDYKNQSVELTF